MTRRSTPALAGKPRASVDLVAIVRVHPRAGGEAARRRGLETVVDGPPPRWRGSRHHHRGHEDHRGSTPALAGKPASFSNRSRKSRVHPRAGGEAATGGSHAGLAAGPPPRWRGSLRDAPTDRHSDGSTPALAGKPQYASLARVEFKVHPRAGGEARTLRPLPRRSAGPPPRWRGSRFRSRPTGGVIGSTPALAGKPRASGPKRWRRWVHPRAGGEAVVRVERIGDATGPPPRWRGSRRGSGAAEGGEGSTPALAGKPAGYFAHASSARVHPRAGGEAIADPPYSSGGAGPPPRWRGSRVGVAVGRKCLGSTPALAGKPPGEVLFHRVVAVHPRAGGEADDPLTAQQRAVGPPPRWRGSRRGSGAAGASRRSTPALAGKPDLHDRAAGRGDQGPPPRWRGSRQQILPEAPCAGSTPALAGKPHDAIDAAETLRVHPRAGGEASRA